MFGLTIGMPGTNNVQSISNPVTVEGGKEYTVTFSNGNTRILYVEGSLTITDIVKTASSDIIDVYTVTYSDDSTDTFEEPSGKHTFDHFGLVMTKYYIPEPEVKMQQVDLPFASGSIDLTDATGETPYKDRNGLLFEFVIQDKKYSGWDTAIQTLAMYLHGQKMHLISDNDTAYYYVVRLHVDWDKSYKHYGTITLSGTAEPFKYNLTASNEPWLWDPFNFVNGQIITTSDIDVSGDTTVTIPAGGVATSPTFVVTQSNGLKVVRPTVPPQELSMPQSGTYRFPQIKAGGAQPTTITLRGNGRVSIAYRSRFL